jgi:peroxiredoxin
MHVAIFCRTLFAACLLTATTSLAFGQSPGEDARPPLKDPSVLLLGDAAIHAELALTPAETAALQKLLLEYNDVLLAIRDTGAGGAADALRPKIHELREKLALSPEQRSNLAAIMDEFWTASQQLQSKGNDQSPDQLKAEVQKLQAERHRRVIAELDEKQEKLWGETLGGPFDFSTLRGSPARAPEFVEVDEWINSPPLALAGLRGKVVVFHFFAFQCSNCHNNFPWYRQWFDELAGQPVVMIGIHTPETATEEDNDLLKAALAEHDLKFPVAVDKSKRNWAAWHNGIWPSVYLVDKQGRLRFWWYGELNWQGAGAQTLMRKRIDQLLAEPEPQP